MKAKESIIKTVLIALTCALIALMTAVLLKGWIDGDFDSFETLRDYIGSFGAWGPVVLMVFQAFQVVLPVLPGFTGCIVGAALFGPVVGFVISYIGMCAGSIAAYYLARKYGIKLVSKLVKMEKYERWIARINASKSYTVFLLACIVLPAVPDDFLCFFSGLVDMPPKKFIPIILAGKPWCILVYCIFSAYFIP